MDAWWKAAQILDRRLDDIDRAVDAYSRVPSDSPRYDDARSLTEAMVLGSERAWRAFVDRCFDHAAAVARSLTGRDESFCHDAAQDAMVRAVRNVRVIESNRELLACF